MTHLKLHTSTAYVTYLNVHSSIGGVMVKSNVLYTLCLLVQRSKLCTVQHCVVQIYSMTMSGAILQQFGFAEFIITLELF